jgi:AraC-like DNA-binding protein
MPTSSSRTLQTGSATATLLLDYLARRGSPPETILAEAGLRPVDLQSGGRIPRASNQKLWASAVEITQDDALGLHLAQFAQPGLYGLAEFVAGSAANLRETAYRIAELGRLNHDLIHFEVEEDEEGIRLTHELSDGRRQPPPVVDFVVAYLTMAGRRMAGREKAIIGVALARPQPDSTVEYERVLRAPLRFDAKASVLILDREIALQELSTTHTELHRLLRRQAEARLRALPRLDTFSEHARAAVRETLVTEAGKASEVARRLGVSERSLRRRLAESGTSHSTLLEQVRRDLAFEMEARHNGSQIDVAIELGYASARAYRRAFRRWTGATPSQWRRSIHSEAATGVRGPGERSAE